MKSNGKKRGLRRVWRLLQWWIKCTDRQIARMDEYRRKEFLEQIQESTY